GEKPERWVRQTDFSNDEAAGYLAIMRLFTTGISGFLSDQSAAEVVDRLAERGVEMDPDTVDARLSYLVEHGNLARSPRETEARSVREYLTNRARYQLTQRGELVHRQVEELLEHTESAREVSSEMLGGILAGLEHLDTFARGDVADVDPKDLSGRIGTLFAQFELLVSSTRQFYTYLSQVLTRYDLGRDEFLMFKGALLDYLGRFVEEIGRHLPQIADLLGRLEPAVPGLCERARDGARLVGVDGREARRAPGLDPADWLGLRAWFVGSTGRRADADQGRRLATDAMRSLLVNLRRIAGGADRQQSRYADLVALARWFDAADDELAHRLWAAAFGLYSARHLGFAADDDADPVPPTASWWQTPVAEVPVSLRRYGERKSGGRSGARVDYSAAKQARLAERDRVQAERAAALRELADQPGQARELRLSDEGRKELLELYSRALTEHGRPLGDRDTAAVEVPADEERLRLSITAAPGETVTVLSPQGRLALAGIRLEIRLVAEHSDVRRAEA
ncbi:MAG: TIGR02677 family protein, partial [Nocardioidaceae bacterium]